MDEDIDDPDLFSFRRRPTILVPAVGLLLFGIVAAVLVVVASRFQERELPQVKQEFVVRPEPPDEIVTFEPSVKFRKPPFPGGLHCRVPADRDSLELSPDGRFLSIDGIILDLKTQRELYHFPRGVIAFSDDSKRLAALGDGTRQDWIIVWDLWQAKRIAELKPNRDPRSRELVRAVQFSPDGMRLVTGVQIEKSRDFAGSFLRVWDIATARADVEIPVGKSAIRGVSFSPDGALIYAWSFGFITLRCWDARTGRLIKDDWRPPCDDGCVRRLPEGLRVLGCKREANGFVKQVILADVEQGMELHRFEPGNGVFGPVACSPNGKWGAFRSERPAGEVIFIDVLAGKRRGVLNIGYSHCAISPDGRSLFALSGDRLRQWDIAGLDVPPP